MVEQMPADKQSGPSLEGEARDLYALRPEEFVQARDARSAELASVNGPLAREIQKLRKPTTAAWALNLLVRTNSEDVGQLVGLGAAFRDAQTTFSAEQLQQLEPQRRQILQAITQYAREAAEDAGQPLSDTIAADVDETLRAAMADEAAGTALTTGLLVRSFDANGLDPADLDGALAYPDAKPMIESSSPQGRKSAVVTQQDKRSDREAVKVAEQALREAQQLAAQAAGAVDEARQAADAAALRRQSLERERQDVQTQLAHVNEQLRSAKLEEGQTRKAAETAQRSAESARRAEQKAAADLERDRP
jgi:hypothetical protein